MGHYNQEAHSHDYQVYPPLPPQSYPSQPQQQQHPYRSYYQGLAYVAPPPPIGYPTKDGPAGLNQQAAYVPVKTKARGEGFWKGCVAAICCCWVLDFCCC